MSDFDAPFACKVLVEVELLFQLEHLVAGVGGALSFFASVVRWN
jgi:hypothetical protein